MNLHSNYLYVMRKDGHYDIIYKQEHIRFGNIEILKDCD